MRLSALFAVLATPAFAMDGGAPVAADDPLAAATVAIQVAEPAGEGRYRSHECSGVLIASDLVLTAGHCVDKAARPEHVAVFFFDGSKAVAPYARVASVTAHSGHSKGWANTPGDIETRQSQVANDLAVLRLAAPAKRKPLGFDTAPRPDALVIAAAGKARTGKSGVLKKAPLTGLYHTRSGPPLVFGSPGGAVCTGDSGGPAVTSAGGVWGVLGAITKAADGCSSRAVVVPVNPSDPAIAAMLRVARGG